MSQTELWYNKLGFFNNPFSIKPAAFHSEIIGYELDEIFGKIESGSVIYICGPMGVGKTTILKNVLSKFGGKGRVIYTSSNTSDKKTNFRQLLVNTSFMNRLFSSPSKNMILLVDESQDIKKQEANEILKLFKKGNFKSVIFFGTEYAREKFSDEINALVKDNVTYLSKLKSEHAVELIRKRVGDIQMISDPSIKKVYKLSGYNPRKLLENCEDLFKYAADRNAEKITDEHIKAVVKEVREPKKKVNKAPRIVIEEIQDVDLRLEMHHQKPKKAAKAASSFDVRTYEEEMSTLKPEVNEDI